MFPRIATRAAVAADRTSGVDRALRPSYGVPSEPATILGVGGYLRLAVQYLLILRTRCPSLAPFTRPAEHTRFSGFTVAIERIDRFQIMHARRPP